MNLHTEQQASAREAKRQKRELARQRELAKEIAARRRITECSISKDDLLRILIDEGFAPDGATKIIGTGHRPDELTFTVSFD